MTGITEGFSQQLQQSLNQVFLPTFLKMILPYVIAILIFGVIRIIFARIFREQRAIKVCIDAIIVLAFLAVCVFVLLPITTHFITDGDILGGTEISVPEYSGSDPFKIVS